MKVHSQAQDPSKILRLLSCTYTNTYNRGFVEHSKAECRIHNSTLLVREQRIFMIPTSRSPPVPLRTSSPIQPCPHHPALTLPAILQLGMRIPRRAEEIESHVNEQGILCCEYCYTEFRIDFKSYGSAGNAMFITRWMDVGEGRDDLVGDVKWRNRLERVGELSGRKVVYDRGSISTAFEQAPGFRFDSLVTERDLKRLSRKSYWPWPKDDTIPLCDDIRPFFKVVNGKFVSLSGSGQTGLRIDRY